MMATKAPPPTATGYRLVELKQEALKIQTKIDDFHQWGAPALDLQGYQKKEALQRSTAHSQRGSIFWALVERTAAHADGVLGSDEDVGDEDIVAGETEMVCHCESHQFDCVFRKPHGEIVRGFSHHIGSVFTLPQHRGKGLARFFIRAIKARTAAMPNIIASALYSEIGPTFYDSLGWHLYESTEARLHLSAPRNAARVGESSGDAEGETVTKLFLDENFDEVLKRDNERLIKDIGSASYEGQEVFASLLTRDSVEWQFCLGVLYADIRGLPQAPTQAGAYIDDDAFIVWSHNIKASTLYVQHVRLLRAAIAEAHRFGLASVAIWDPSDLLLDAAVLRDLDVVKGEHGDSLSHLVVFDQHRSPGATALPLWLSNEKHAWV